MMLHWSKPLEGEFLPYQKVYLDRVPEGDVIAILKKNIIENTDFFKQLSPEQIEYCYAEGKWNIKEILQHLIDTERIMCYRALRFARKDDTPLPGFEQDDYVLYANTGERDFRDMILEFEAVRSATVFLFNSFNDAILQQSGTSNIGKVKVNSLAYVIAGHELHHIAIIKEKYFPQAES